MKKIKFPTADQKIISKDLNARVQTKLGDGSILKRAYRILWLKFVLYAFAYLGAFVSFNLIQYESKIFVVLHYCLFGLLGILLAFNAAHDAAHGTFSKNKFVNDVIFRFTFNVNGVNSYLWKIRHVASHHLFPNVDGTDADLDENALLRLSPTHRLRFMHRYQHIYASVLYLFYTLQWIFYKDFIYLRRKKLSNLKNIQHSALEVFRFFLWKIIYLAMYVAVPMIAGYDWKIVLLSFVLMHMIISLFFVWTLIISHLTCETAFPLKNEEGVLPFNYYEHQLATSMDYRPKSVLMNWFLGGFNAHAAHHLFPKWPHTMNRHVTFCIQRTAVAHGLPYNSKTFVGALASHYKYLYKMGSSIEMK